MIAREVFDGSDGAVTKAYYAELEKRGLRGKMAVALFRAQKCSTRAKKYRGGIRGVGSFKSMAYDKKAWSLQELCKQLQHGSVFMEKWGWKQDPNVVFGSEPSWVLYVDLVFASDGIKFGQVSFHNPTRYEGPDYPGEWDGEHKSEERVIAFCDQIMATEVSPSLGL
jgi:hypothetical protein